jgi:hypothetical protein
MEPRMISIPSKINYSWKDGLLDEGIESYYIQEINQKVSELKSIESPENQTHPTITKLNSQSFWEDLQRHADDKEKIGHLKTIWQHSAPFTHLSLQQLWEYKVKQIQPLRTKIEALKDEQEAERAMADEYFTPTQPFHLTAIDSTKAKFESCLTELSNFETDLQNSAYARLELYKINQNHRVDAPVKTIAAAINKLNIVGKLSVPKVEKECISDDLRTCFYDWLVNSNPSRKKQFDTIIEPIHQKGFTPIIANSEVEEDKKLFAKFREQIDDKLFFSARAQKRYHDKQQYFAVKIAKWIANLVLPKPILRTLQFLWYARWAVLQVALAGVYLWGAAALLGPVAAFIGLSLGSVTTLAFYGVVMFPTWMLAYKAFNWATDIVSDWLVRPKKTQIFNALDDLEEAQRFISSELSQGILDVSHFDIKNHEKNVNDLIIKLEKIEKHLKSSWFWERWLFKDTLLQAKRVSEKINDKIGCIKNRQERIASDIAKRLPGNLKQLHKNQVTNKVEPIFPAEQNKNLGAFVNKFGNEATKASFKANTNMVKGFVKALAKQKCLYVESTKSEVNVPWGNHKVHSAALNGWQTLISHFEQDASSKKAGESLIKLLKGEEYITLPELEAAILKLSPNDFDNTLKQVQIHIYLCLSNYPYQYAALLSAYQKQKISTWHKKHVDMIKTANDFINSTISDDGPDKRQISSVKESELVKYFQAFEGDCFARAANGDRAHDAQNSVKNYLANYQGEDPKALYLVRFIPKHTKAVTIDKIASKRLDWLIDNCGRESAISDTDIELFYHPVLNERASKFSFNSQIRQHIKFSDEYDEKFLNFLNQCKNCGLVSTSLIKKYKALHEHEKENKPVTPQFDTKEPKSCHQRVNTQNAPEFHRSAPCA